MAAPSGISWGSVVNNGTNKAARLGIYTSLSSNNTTTTVSVQVWLWTRYAVSDSSNTVYFNWGATSASTSVKSNVSVSTTNTEWSTSNQVQLYSTSKSYTRETSATAYNCAAQITGLNFIGTAVSTYKSFSVPAKPSYTVTYDANGGTGAPSAQTKWYGTALTLSSATPTRTGYTFAGWNTAANGSGTAYAAGASYSSEAAVTLYAKWTAVTYSVTYDANGGSGAPAAQTKTHGTALTLSSTKPTRTNYTFKGWGLSATSTTVAYASGASYTTDAPIALYAVWELAYTKPRITNLVVRRSTSAGAASDAGTYGAASFSWATDKTVSSIKIEWKLATATSYSSSNVKTISASGTSGTVTASAGTFGSGAISVESTYTVRVTVTDSGGSTSQTATIGGKVYPVDFLAGGTGVAFGKPAETANTLDVAWHLYMNGGTSQADAAAIKWRPINSKNPYFGYAANQTDGTVVWSITGTGYGTGLAIGGGSGNLLWKGTKVATVNDNVASATTASGLSSTLDIAKGGTGATTAANARIALAGHAGYHASATGSASTLSLSASTITALTLDTWRQRNTTDFTFSGGGIYCPYAGTVLIIGQVYIQAASATCRTGAYVCKNGSEITANYSLADYAPVTTVITSVAAGDVITLRARASVATTAYPSNASTHLDIIYLT